jgi:hypothetical protein
VNRSKPDDGLRRIFKAELEVLQFHCQSVETGGTGQGIPDTNYCVEGVEGWIEFKATDGHAVTLRPEQIGWIERRLRHGGRVWIAVRQRHDGGPRRGAAVDALHLLPGHVARAARLGGLRASEVVANRAGLWQGGPSRWDWSEVAQILRWI